MQSGASDNGIVLFLCAIAYHIRGNDLVREEPSLPDHFWAKVRPGRTSGPERTVPSGPPSPSDQGEKNILAENCHLAKICVYNIVPIKNFGTANNKDRYRGKDKYGNDWNIRLNDDGTQDWVRSQHQVINEGGRNIEPRPWDDETGLFRNPTRR